MPLIEHLRELRSRLFRSVLAIAAGTVVGFVFYDEILAFLKRPYIEAGRRLRADGKNITTELVFTNVSDGFTFNLKIALVTGIVLASPVWLWQIWRFIVPALHRTERKWSAVFAGIAGPLFLSGVALGYFVLPKGMQILISFIPNGVDLLQTLPAYLNLVLRIMLVFAIAFEIPLFVVLLNLAGVVKGRQLGQARAWIVLGIFVFAAVATPTTDPVTMLLLALPMTVLFMISEVVARLIDRRRDRADPNRGLDDDVASPI